MKHEISSFHLICFACLHWAPSMVGKLLKDVHIHTCVQVYMEISCPDGGNGGRKDVFPATHEEIHPTGILSVVANLTPWSDHNQSPRNMYQCQVFHLLILSYVSIFFLIPLANVFILTACHYLVIDGKTNNGFLLSSIKF